MIIGLICTILGVLISYLTLYWNRKKELKKESKEVTERNIRVELKLDNICNNLSEIRLEQKDTSKMLINLNERITLVEQSAIQAHKRIDKIETECDRND